MRKLACVMAAAAVVACVACGDSQDDSSISTSVGAKLTADQKAGTSQVKVETKDQVVTLSGTVDTPAAKEQAVRSARETEGVKEVVDNIQVSSTETAEAAAQTGAEIGDSAAKAASATGEAAKATGNVVVDSAKSTGNVIVEGAKATGDAAVKGAEATASGAKKLGSGILGAVTPDKEKK